MQQFFSTRRHWDTGCFPPCAVQVQTVGSLPPPLTPVEHCMMLAHPVASLMSRCWSSNSWSCISCISGLRHPVFVNCLCLPITWRKSLWVKETSKLLGLVKRGNTIPLNPNRRQLDPLMPFYHREPSEETERGHGKQWDECVNPKKAALRNRSRTLTAQLLLEVQKIWSLWPFSSLPPFWALWAQPLFLVLE